jgi:hypothetical protein
LHAPGGDNGTAELLGWAQTPEDATHLQLCVPDRSLAGDVAEIVFHDVSERDPKCHPAANVPRWGVHRPPFEVKTVVLPSSLHDLVGDVDWAVLKVVERPESLERLAKLSRQAVCVLDPQWVTGLGLTLADLEGLAEQGWLIVDLETMAGVLRRAGAAATEVRRHVSDHGIMSARVEYGDVATRGLALQDVVPYSTLSVGGGFAVRALRATRGWRAYADEAGFATFLATETPWVQKHGDVLSAALPGSRGELVATDLPWLVAGHQGELLAPQIARHLLRMHLGAPLADHLQYWNRWDDGNVVVRDLSDLARRYAPLAAVRWQSGDDRLAHLGVALLPPGGRRRRQTMFCTGRIDTLSAHEGLPPEPMAIFMKWLAREAREGTDWARRHLAEQVVSWQFDTADGLRYAVNFDSARELGEPAPRICRLRVMDGRVVDERGEVVVAHDEGLYGDRSLAYLDALVGWLRREIEAG